MIYAWEVVCDISSAVQWRLMLKLVRLLGSRFKSGGRRHNVVSNLTKLTI